MKLVPSSAILSALGFEDMPDINEAVDMSLHMATQILARHMDTNFDIEAVEDVFYVPPYFKAEPDGFTHTVLRLSRGFVAGTPVVQGSNYPGFDDYEIVQTMRCESEDGRQKGIMKDYQTSYVSGNRTRLFAAPGPYIKVQYGSGFLTDPLDLQLYLQAQVPDWLKELAKMQTLMLLSQNPLVVQAQVAQPTEALQHTFSAILSKHQRFYPSALIPLYSKESGSV